MVHRRCRSCLRAPARYATGQPPSLLTQGGLRCHQLYMLARGLTIWSCDRFLSVRVTHVPGIVNVGGQTCSPGAHRCTESGRFPCVVQQIWARYQGATVDLFVSREKPAVRQILLVDALAHVWPHELLYAFPPLALIPPPSGGQPGHRGNHSAYLAGEAAALTSFTCSWHIALHSIFAALSIDTK